MQKPLTIDLFAGAGGFGLGFQQSNFDLIYSLEIDKWASETLSQNNEHKITNKNILDFNKEDIIREISDKPEIIIGGPPCQGFSNAGQRSNNDPRNKMYKEFLNWVNIFRPKTFIIENVRGILSFKNSNDIKVIDDIKSIINPLGYKISIWKLNAANYGVPQNRQRAFIIGHNEIENIAPPPITHSYEDDSLPNPITVSKAIDDLPFIKAREGAEIMDYELEPKNSYQKMLRGNNNKVFNHVAMKHTDRVISRYEKIIEGDKLEDLNDELKVRKRNGNGELSESKFSLNYRYLNPNLPSYTIPAHFYSSFIHPTIPRNITTREAARIQSFPDWYRFSGKRTMISSKLLKQLGKEDLNHLSQYNQVGNAVPPILASRIASYLKDFL